MPCGGFLQPRAASPGAGGGAERAEDKPRPRAHVVVVVARGSPESSGGWRNAEPQATHCLGPTSSRDGVPGTLEPMGLWGGPDHRVKRSGSRRPPVSPRNVQDPPGAGRPQQVLGRPRKQDAAAPEAKCWDLWCRHRDPPHGWAVQPPRAPHPAPHPPGGQTQTPRAAPHRQLASLLQKRAEPPRRRHPTQPGPPWPGPGATQGSASSLTCQVKALPESCELR